MKRLWAATAVAALAIAGCGGDDSGSGGDLVVSAAASLQKAFEAYSSDSGQKVKFSFAGSDALAAQIEQGLKPDVFASANTKLPQALYKKKLVEKPVVFAGNRLVLAVPKGSKITSLSDIEKSGVKLAIGSKTVPVGSYTRTVLGNLPAAEEKAIMKNVKSEEPDVKGLVGKLTQGAVDAGFIYISDVKGTKGKLKGISLPAKLKPSAKYGVAIVTGAKHKDAAQKFIDGLLNGDGQKELHKAGFLAP